MHMENKKPETTPSPTPAHSFSGGSSLLEEVEIKNHTSSNAVVDPNLLNQPLGEAVIGASNALNEEDPFMKEIKKDQERKASEKRAPAGSAAKPAAAGPGFTNPALVDISPEKKQEAAENLAKLTVIGYENAANFFDKRLQVSQRKLMRIRTAGKIDMDTPIPVEGGVVSFEEFIGTYNEQTKGTIGVDQKFKDQVEPLLASIFAKRGQGLSEEQMLIGLVAQHVIISSQKFIASQQTFRAFMAYATEQSKLSREGRIETARPAAAPYVAPAAQASPGEPPAGPSPTGGGPGPQGPNNDPKYQEFLRREAEMGDEAGASKYQVRQWGGKDNMSAIRKADKLINRRSTVRSSTINTEEPEKRKRVHTGKSNTSKPKRIK